MNAWFVCMHLNLQKTPIGYIAAHVYFMNRIPLCDCSGYNLNVYDILAAGNLLVYSSSAAENDGEKKAMSRGAWVKF